MAKLLDTVDEYKISSGQTIYKDRMDDGSYQVSCVNEDDTVHWLKEFHLEAEADAEFTRWRR